MSGVYLTRGSNTVEVLSSGPTGQLKITLAAIASD